MCLAANSQQLSMDYYNRSNGLVNNEVQCITQASNGFMFFGTPSGCSVFDGYSFTNYDLNKGFTGNSVSGMCEMRSGEIDLFTGSYLFYRISNQHLRSDSLEEKIAIKNIYKGKSGNWYATTFSGLYIFTDGKLKKLPVSEGKSFYGINRVMEWQDSLLVVGRSYETVDIYNRRTWKLVASSFEKIFVRDICTDSEGNIWIASIGAGVLKLLSTITVGNKVQFEKLPPVFDSFLQKEFRAIVCDKQNNLWMGSVNTGLLKYNLSSQKLDHFTTDQGLASNTILSLYNDREDNIWIGTNNGLQKLVHKDVYLYTSRQGLPSDLVLDVLPLSDHRLLTCGYAGVGFLASNSGRIKPWQPPLEDENFSQFISIQKEYYGLSLRKLIRLSISMMDVEAKKVYPLPQHFRSMISFNDNKLLLGGDSSILLFENGKINELIKDHVHHIVCMTIDASGILWTGGLNNHINGYQLPKANSTQTVPLAFQYVIATKGKQDFIKCITTDKENRIWYGTSQSGISVLKRNESKVIFQTNIGIQSGLRSNRIICFAWHNDSTLLVGTGYGLDKIVFSKKRSGFIVRNINDYYNFSQAVQSIKKDEEGNYLLGTESGLIKIPSIDIESDIARKLPILITAVKLLSDPDSTIDISRGVELPYNNSSIAISYASPSFTGETAKFIYNMEGSGHEQWSRPSTANSVTFLNLLPGKYRFTVKPVNVGGEPSVTNASVEIIIYSAFWQTWWFRALAIVTFAGLLALTTRRQIANIRKESIFKQQRAMFAQKISEAEMMALRAQMNPHFIFNCMNIIDGLITDDRKEDAQNFLQKFSKLIRLVLENSQHQLVSIQQDLHALKLYIELEMVRSSHGFKYEIDLGKELLSNDYKIPPLLLQPYVENAIVHGLRNKETGEGKLLVQIKSSQDKILITIEDNGIGRKKAMLLNEENKKPNQQLGMKMTGKRIGLLQSMNHNEVKIHISDVCSDDETGTRVEIVLPYNLEFEKL
ncbi:histidine kinase [Cytophagales bacterium WSM2-2]|nr:histidine kinase [Cytophagales bacterium WSM2-2]